MSALMAIQRMRNLLTYSVTFADVQAARDKIAGAVERTPPGLHSDAVPHFNCEVWLKFENLQFTASFKSAARSTAAFADCRRQGARCDRHERRQSCAGRGLSAGRLGIPATIVMPAYTPFVKVRNTEGHGAKVVLHGNTLAEASQHARDLAAKHKYVFVHPFDDPYIIAGQGTLALECWRPHPTSTRW